MATTVTTQACSSVAQTTCTGNGTVVTYVGDFVTRRGFCYKAGTSGDPTTSDSTVYDDGTWIMYGVAYTKAITGLTTNTSYRVRAYAIADGTGYGATVQLSTLLQTSGAISMDNVNIRLVIASGTQISLNDAAVRALFVKASGAIDLQDGYGK
jgi:hypothetical protein